MIRTLSLAAALTGTMLLAAPASAAPLSATSTAALALAENGKNLTETVQYRRYGPRYGYRGGPRYGYRGGYGYRTGRGAAVGAGIAAGAIGALAAGALLAPRSVYAEPVYAEPLYAEPLYRASPVYGAGDVDAVAYCSRRFRSYDPETGTYIGTGGVVRSCP